MISQKTSKQTLGDAKKDYHAMTHIHEIFLVQRNTLGQCHNGPPRFGFFLTVKIYSHCLARVIAYMCWGWRYWLW